MHKSRKSTKKKPAKRGAVWEIRLASRVFLKCRYIYAAGSFFLIWGFCISPTSAYNKVNSFFLHPIDNIEPFSLALFFSALISWMLHDLRNEREELQHIVATTLPATYDSSVLDREFYSEIFDLPLREGKSTRKAHLIEFILNGKYEIRKRHSISSEQLIGNKFASSFLFFINLLIVGYITYCVSRAAILNKSISIMDLLQVIFNAFQFEAGVM